MDTIVRLAVSILTRCSAALYPGGDDVVFISPLAARPDSISFPPTTPQYQHFFFHA